ncbi:MAG: signal peptidase I [Lachnospiraceae bacterium]|nr:signal peptidase I [Robinsoniella sp.]MDY3766255.1 signal peptidase I [Lachnospiraceae bacterium]
MRKKTETEQPKDQSGEEKKLDVKAEIWSWVRWLACTAVVVVILTQVIFINARIPSGSMENTIMTKSRVIGFRFSYWFDEPERGDIIIFKYPVDEKQNYIKRIIGLPGETVEIRNGNVYIDGSETPLAEDYLKEEWIWKNDGYTFEVPEGCYFVMGDNRNRSEDARFWAEIALREGVAETEEEAQQYSFVRKDQIEGKAIFCYFPSIYMLK